MNGDFVFYLSGSMLLLACLLKLPALVRTRGRDRLLSSIFTLLLVASCVLFLTAPSVIVLLRQLTGVTNIAAPLIYILLTAFSGASIVLVLNWRGGPDVAQTRRLSRITIAVYGTCCIMIAVLFTLGDTPVEKRTTFDTYYATTPFIREMIVLYLAAHATATLTASRLCWRWSHEVRGTLRIGLRLLTAAYLMHCAGYDPAVAIAVAARWAGHDWNFLIDIARATTAPSAGLVAIGFIIPLVGPRSEEVVRYWQLAPLAKAVRPVQGAPGPTALPIPWWKPNVRLRLTQRQTYISDRIVACRSHFDLRVKNEARAAALDSKATEETAAIIAEAAMIAVAVELRCTTNGKTAPGPPSLAPEQRPSYTGDLADIAGALHSRIVKDIRRRTRAERASV